MQLIFAAIGTVLITTTASTSAQTIPVTPPPAYSYEANTVRQLEVRGQFGRYLTFTGKTVNKYEGTKGFYNPGNPGYLQCYGTYTKQCIRMGYVAPSYSPGTPGGSQAENFVYDLDCTDMTFDRKGDRGDGISGNRGWLPVSSDPTASEVARIYCPKISTLPGGPEASTAQDTITVNQNNESEWLYLGEYGEKGEKKKHYVRRVGTVSGMPIGEVLFINPNGDREEGLITVWDCKGYQWRNQDESEWIKVDPGTAGEDELIALCGE